MPQSLHFPNDPLAYFANFIKNPASSADYVNTYDLIMIVPMAVILTFIRVILEALFHRLGQFLVSINKPSFLLEKPKECAEKMIKFREQVFKLTFHGGIALLALFLFGGQEWWEDPSKSLRTDVTVKQFTPSFKFYYIVQTGFHLHSLVYHYIERSNGGPRSDDLQMQVHHFATIFLTCGSFYLGHLTTGTLVLYVHDMSDVFVSLTKALNYTKFPDPILALSLSSLVFSWAYYRLYRFPVDVILNVWEHFDYPNGGLFLKSLNWAVVLLLVLHWIWFYQIIQIPLAMVRGNREYDTTENWKEATKDSLNKDGSNKKKGRAQREDTTAHVKQQ